MDYPILEFDADPLGIINPRAYGVDSAFPEKGILCFFSDVIKELRRKKMLVKIGQFRSEMGFNPVLQLVHQGPPLFVLHPGIGAPLAAGFLEEVIACGAKQVIACGGCGVLVPEIAAGHFLIIESAIRDEGTSYHYIPPAREIRSSDRVNKALEKTLAAQAVRFSRVKSWTTDGFYRETARSRNDRISEGCSIVEMEAAALFAVAQFRRIQLGEIVYGGDLVVPEGWDSRAWYRRRDDRLNLFWMAVKACSGL